MCLPTNGLHFIKDVSEIGKCQYSILTISGYILKSVFWGSQHLPIIEDCFHFKALRKDCDVFEIYVRNKPEVEVVMLRKLH